MGNASSVLLVYNRDIWYPKKSEFGCSSRSRTDCLHDTNCLTPKIVYQAYVQKVTNDDKKFYFGISETIFEERFRNYKKECTHKKYRVALSCQNIYGN